MTKKGAYGTIKRKMQNAQSVFRCIVKQPRSRVIGVTVGQIRMPLFGGVKSVDLNGGVIMTQTNTRVVKIIAVTLLAAIVLSLCVYGFFYGVGKIFFSTYEKKLTKFDSHFVNVCQESGLDLTQAEFLFGTYRSALRGCLYFVGFRVPAEKESLLFAEKEPVRCYLSDSDKQNLPDDGVEYIWRSDMSRLQLYRSDAAEDGYVYCYVDYSYD